MNSTVKASPARDPAELAALHFKAIATGDATLAAQCIHPAHVNHMAADEPPSCALPGLPGFMATSAWLRFAFPNLTFEPIEMATEGERTIAHVWMRGRQTGPFVVFPPGQSPMAFPPTGREFAVRHCHIFRMRDGLHAEHIAVRDDIAMMTQLGHLPPSGAVAARLLVWNITGRAKAAVAKAISIAASAAQASTE